MTTAFSRLMSCTACAATRSPSRRRLTGSEQQQQAPNTSARTIKYQLSR